MRNLIIIMLCMFLSGCTTLTKNELKKINMVVYRDGARYGYGLCLYDSVIEGREGLRRILND